MKYISPSKTATELNKRGQPMQNKKFERGVADLAIEARFLALLSHQHIIKLHYVSGGRFEEQYNCDEEGGHEYRNRFGMFLLLDPLHETLQRRIQGTYIPEVVGGTGTMRGAGPG